MSSDAGKENVSVVESSVTEWKRESGTLDHPESSNFQAREVDVLDERIYSCNRVEISNSNADDKLYGTRYFIIKSLNHQNIQLSVKKGIWATQVMNEPILDEAFHNSGRVILIFSVNMSGFFQGYAQMMSSVGWRRDNVWSQGSGGSNPWGRSFKVKWLQLSDLPFQKTLHLRNPLNDFKPVKISRDCQELPQDLGEALCELLDGELRRDDFFSKMPCMESSGDGFDVPPLHMPWTPMLYPPPMLYPTENEATLFQLAYQGSTGTPSDHSAIASKLTHLKNSSEISQFDPLWGLPARKDSDSHSNILTEDDFLEMTYEEYLEIHSRGHSKLYDDGGASSPAVLPSQELLLRNKDHDDSLRSSHGSRKRTRSSQS